MPAEECSEVGSEEGSKKEGVEEDGEADVDREGLRVEGGEGGVEEGG